MVDFKGLFRNTLFLIIFLLNILILLIPTQGGEFLNNENLGVQLLRGFGFRLQNRENYSSIPRLGNNSMTDQTLGIDLFNPHFKQSEYFIPGWADTRFNFRKNISIDATKVSANLINFPVLIDLYDPDLQNDAQASGNDIFFTDLTGYILDHEIESYDRIYNSTHAHLVGWVKTNLSSSQDTLLSMYYGNPTANNQENPEGVWDSNYMMVQHLSESGIGTRYDSTSNDNSGTPDGYNGDEATAGKIAGADDFNGISDNIAIEDSSSLDITDAITIEAWIVDDVAERRRIVTKGSEIYVLRTDYSGILHGYLKKGGNLYHVKSQNNLITTSTFHYVAFTWDGVSGDHNLRLFHNGFELGSYSTQDTVTSPLNTSTDSLFIGSHGSGEWWDGKIDEVRISSIARSADWITTEYNNQYDPTSFYSVEKKENAPDYWAFPTFRFRKTITIDSTKVSDDLTNFPVLVDISDSDLKDSKIQPDADDVTFTDNSGAKLDHEIEYFNQNSSHGHLIAWVRLPSLSSMSDTNITMYYGNPALISQENPEGVWDSNFMTVQHLEENPTGTITDSTGANDMTGSNMDVSDLITGQIGDGFNFDSAGTEYLTSSTTITLEEFTFSLWADPETHPDWEVLLNFDTSGGNYRYFAIADDNSLGYDGEGGLSYFGSGVPQSVWQFFVLTYDGSQMRVYRNGNQFGSAVSKTIQQRTDDFEVASYSNGVELFDGQMDEVRISNIARPADWILTEYNNQFEPNSFYSVAEEEEYSDWWADGSFRYRKNIILNKENILANLTNFPVLIDLTDSDLKSGKVQPDGDDIIFVDQSGAKLNHELEKFQQNSSQGRLIAWVRVSSLSNVSDTNITMYYGNSAVNSQEDPTGLWENNYVGVWHLSESNGNALDSTSYGVSGTLSGGVTQGVTGQVHNTYDFNGVDSKVDMGDPVDDHLDFGTGSFTVETWIYRNSSMTSDQYGGIFKGNGDVDDQNGWLFRFKGSDTVRFSGGDGTASVFNIYKSSTLVDDTWIHLVGVLDRDAGRAYIYKDGQLIATDTSITSGNIDSTRSLVLSEDWSSSYHFKGLIDEIRLSNIARSAAWIETEYNNQYDPDSFYSIGSDEEYQNWWADASFSKRKDIVINKDKVSGDLSNFPVLIDITDSGLKNGKVQPDAADIMFISENSVKLNHEIEFFSQNSSHGHLIAWVKVPTLFNSRDTLISMYYGNNDLTNQENSEGVWTDYVAVWHLAETTGDAQDSTSYTTSGTISGTINQGTSGQIGNAYDFTTTGQVTIGNPADGHLDFATDSFTFSCWLIIDQNTGNNQLPIYKGGTSAGTTGYCLAVSNDGQDLTPAISDGVGNQGYNYTAISLDTWIYSVGVINRSNNRLLAYIDGSEITSNDISSISGISNNYAMTFSDSSYPFDGILDEVRVSRIAHSADWILTEYNNQHDPANFYSVGSECVSFDLEAASFGFVWLDTPYEIDLGSTYNSWVEHDLSENGVPSQATGVILAWIETDGGDTPVIARGIEDTNDYMAGGSIYNELEDKTWKMQIVKLGSNRTIETWRGEIEDKLYVMGYTMGPDPWYRPIPTDLGSLTADSTWRTITVNGVDDDTTGVILLGQSLSSTDSFIAVRAVGSTDDMTTRLWQEYNSGVVFVKIDENDQFEYYINASTKFYVIAEVKNSIDWLDTNRDDISPPSGWTMRDLDSYITVPSSASGVILQFESMDSSDHRNIPREYGQDWIFPSPAGDVGSEAWIMVGSGIDSENRVEIYSEQGTPDLYNYIHALTIYVGDDPPIINDFGVDDPGTGLGKFWADVTDDTSDVEDVTLSVNGTEYSMSFNGTYWIYQQSVIYQGFYSYQIVNASNSRGNYITNPSEVKDHTFNKDTVLPDVLQWNYVQANNTFQANVTDSWGVIDTVIVNVTTYSLNATMVYYKTFGSNTLAYMNDTINMPNGPIDFQIIVNDTSGNEFISTTHSGTVYDNHPPVVSDLTLSRDQFQVLLPVFSNCTLYLDYTYSDEDGHGEDGTEIRWYKNNGTGFELQPDRNDSLTISASLLEKGDEWYATVRPKDGDLFGEINQTATITIQNAPPQVSSVVVSPSNPVTTQSLSVSNTTTDADGDSITAYQIRWYNPSYNSSYDNQVTIPSDQTAKGETWWCELRAFDGTNYSSWVTSNSVTIENSAPSASNLAIIPSDPQTADMLTADYNFTDADSDPESGSIIRWYKNGVLQGALNDSLTVNPGNTSKGDTWYFKITPSDGNDLGLEKTSDPVTILNTAPTASSLFISPASPVTTTILTANYTWADADLGDSESGSEIIWYRNNILLGALNNSVTVDPSYTTKGEEWHFKVRPSDGADYGTWTSCPTNLTIGNVAPEATNLALTPSDAKTGNDLSAAYTWVDEDTADSETDTIVYWYLDRTGSFVLQSAYTNLSILSSTATQKGDMWKFGIIPSDGYDYGVQLNSSVITIGNTAPVVLNITINGFNETTMLQLDDNLTVGYIYYDADNADNSSVDTEAAVEIRWYNQSQLVTGLNDELFVFTGNTSSGEIWYCIIRVNDGTLYSNPAWSPSVSIAVPPNTPPQALDVLITPSDPKTGDWLNVTYVYYDEEGDPESFTTFRWYCNGIHQGQYDGIQNLSTANLIKGDTWYAEVRPRDDNDYGDWNASTTVVIGNTAPEATNLMILPASALTGSDLSVDYDWTDADGADSDTNSIIYWYLNRTGSYILQSTYTNQSTVPSTANLKGDWWLYELTPNDGTDIGIAINSTPLLIGNTAPTVSNLIITPLNPVTGDDLTVDYDWLDQDTLDSETGSQIRWYKNGVLQPAYNDSLTVNAGNTAKGENWYFIVVPSDGSDQGLAKTSPIFTIGNTAPSVNNVEFTPGVPTTNIDLSVAYNWTDVDLGDSESGTLIRWYRNDLLQATYNDSLSIDGILIVKGDNWTVSIKASDGTSISPTWVNTSIIVGNTAPTVTSVTISPSFPKTLDALVINYAASDNDSMDTIIAYSIEWLLGGILQPQFNNYTIIPAINTSKGENWQVQVKATDGEDWSGYLASLGLTIGNTKPSVANVTVTGGITTSVNITLTYEFVDVDNDPSSGTTITWRYVGYGSGTYDDLLEIPASYTKAGQQWWVEITPRDTEGAIGETFNSWDYGMVIIVGNSPPALNVSDIAIFGLLNGTEYLDSSFDTTYSLMFHYNATDIDGEQGVAAYGLNLVDGYALDSEYRWYHNRSGVVTLISALNDQVTVPAQYTQKGDLWWVQIRVRDFFGDFSTPKNASKITINNTVPYIQNVYWPKSKYYTTDSLSFSYTFVDYDAGDEEQGLFTRWYRNGTYLPEFDNNVSILALNTTKGDHWYVNISVGDGIAYSAWVAFSEIVILNSAPVAQDIRILPTATPNTTQALNASWVFTDADGDTEESTAAQITWYRNGIVVSSLTNNQTVPASWTNREEVWYFTLRVTDGVNYSVLYQSNTIRVINSAPSPSDIKINLGSSSIYTSDDLTVTWGFTDPDPLDIEDVASTFTLWYLNGQVQDSFTNSSVIPATNTLKGQQWIVSLAVRDNGGLWSEFLNSSIIMINNTPPQVVTFVWSEVDYYTTTNLSFSYLFADADNDTETGILIHWYRNDIYLPEYDNNVSILALNTTKGEHWYVNISVFDGEAYSSWYSLVNVAILNSAPIALNVSILPMTPNTTQPLEVTWDFQDLDGDPENQSAALIQWYQNGILVPDLANQHNVSNDHTRGGDSWYFIVSVFDGSDYSTSYQSNTILILNSAPIALNIQLNAGEPIHTTDSLTVTWGFDDPDPQDIQNLSGVMILWYLSGTLQPQHTNKSSVGSEDLLKGQVWIVTIAVRDSGGLWSVPLNSSSVEIANSAPIITLNAHPEFIVEDTTLHIRSTYYTFFDADGDANDPQIWWYRNNIYQPAYDNSIEISASHTKPGDTWHYIICPFDGTDLGNNYTSPIICIESQPTIDAHDVEAQKTMDGLYHFWVTVSDTRNNITEVRYEISLNGSINPLIYTLNSANATGHWVLHFQLEDYAYLNTTASVTVTVTTTTEARYSQEYTISNTSAFTTLLVDAAPPRIVDTYFVPNGDPNPNTLTFFCELEEYGSGVDQVILYYSFRPVDEIIPNGTGSGAAVEQTYSHISMTKHNESSTSVTYTVTVPFSPNGTNLEVLYQIQASDKVGNLLMWNIPSGDPNNLIAFTSPGIEPTLVMLIVGMTLFLAFFGSIVYVKFIRKPELVGLDKDLVLEKIFEVSDAEIMSSLDDHTIGIVVSFFDQRHGPIPIIVIPEMLKDNFTKLVELSDRSFSGTGFSDDFSAEIPSSYDFVVAHGLRTSIMSFGYALERPQARGGQENLTLNIIIHQDLFPLVQSFQKAIQRQVHELHVHMDNKPDEKDTIRKQVLNLRKYVSSIILSYERIYGTTELIEEED